MAIRGTLLETARVVEKDRDLGLLTGEIEEGETVGIGNIDLIVEEVDHEIGILVEDLETNLTPETKIAITDAEIVIEEGLQGETDGMTGEDLDLRIEKDE